MPIVVQTALDTSRDRFVAIVRIPGLPDFNVDDDPDLSANIDGWYDIVIGEPVISPNGGGPGAIVSATEPAEGYYTLTGRVRTRGDAASIRVMRRLLIAAFPPGMETPLIVAEPDGEALQAFVELYDKPELPVTDDFIDFTLPLLARDPYKYAAAPLEGAFGAFVGENWSGVFTDAAGVWGEEFTFAATTWGEEFNQDVADESTYPPTLTLTSSGDADSRRVTTVVNGPLSQGAWWLENSAQPGNRLYADLTLGAGDSITFDSRNRTAALGTTNIDHLVYGDYLTLTKGQNVYRLVADAAGFATVSALEAFQ